MKLALKSLQLFNAVPEATGLGYTIPEITPEGYVIMPSASGFEALIRGYAEGKRLRGEALNKTFYTSWQKVIETPDSERILEQILHYLSTYGSDFQAPVYLPAGEVDLPKEALNELQFVVIHGLPIKDIIEKCLNMLRSGVAMKQETLEDVIEVLEGFGHEFKMGDGIRNKEAIVMIADKFGVLPPNGEEILRYLVFKMTGQTLLIKNEETIQAIKDQTHFLPNEILSKHKASLAAVFNRFKPLILAMKCTHTAKTINRIAKLSKTLHKPIPQNPLNLVTQQFLLDEDRHWLDNATVYAIFKAIKACASRREPRSAFLYRVRNGKCFAKSADGMFTGFQKEVVNMNTVHLVKYLRERYSFEGKKFYIPENIRYALPTSEKQFVGDSGIPSGTKVIGEKLAVGIYWETAGGTYDYDLSALSQSGDKTGWNADWENLDEGMLFSGDVTDARNGAVEYLYCNAEERMKQSYLLLNNRYKGEANSEFKIIVGDAPAPSEDYMMSPNNRILEISTSDIQRQDIIGFIDPLEDGNIQYTLLHMGAGQAQVSREEKHSTWAIEALREEVQVSFDWLIRQLRGECVNSPDEADYDLSPAKLTKNTFIEIMEEAKLTAR